MGVRSVDGYHSVNTGKLTTAPLFAHRLGATESVGDGGAHSRCLLLRGLLGAQLLLGIHPCISLPYNVSLTL